MNLAQRRLIMNAFIFLQGGYYPLVWMFHSRKLNNGINNIHERALRIVFRDYESTIQQLLTLFFPMFPFDPPENIRKPLVF